MIRNLTFLICYCKAARVFRTYNATGSLLTDILWTGVSLKENGWLKKLARKINLKREKKSNMVYHSIQC